MIVDENVLNHVKYFLKKYRRRAHIERNLNKRKYRMFAQYIMREVRTGDVFEK
jgi:hypothetical protein